MSVSRPILPQDRRRGKRLRARLRRSCFRPAMLAPAPGTPRRDRIAIGGSIAIHCCVLAAALLVIPPPFQANDPDERALLTSLVRVEHRAPKSKGHEQRPPAQAAPAVQGPAPVIHAAVTVE